MIKNCKNCGHPIQRIFWFFWLHLNKYRDQLTIKCHETSDCSCPYPEPELKFKVNKITTPKEYYNFDKKQLKLNRG